MSCFAHWLVPQLSLMTEAEREMDRRRAVKLDHQDLQILADRLIVDCYTHQEVINRCLARVGELEVRLALAEAQPSESDSWQEYVEMAKELLGDLEAS